MVASANTKKKKKQRSKQAKPVHILLPASTALDLLEKALAHMTMETDVYEGAPAALFALGKTGNNINTHF